MNNITIIIPIHKIDQVSDKNLLIASINSVVNNTKNYQGTLTTLIVSSDNIYEDVKDVIDKFNINNDYHVDVICNKGESDFCSQINYAVDFVKDDYFSILEYDDTYTEKWFTMANSYFYGNEDVSVFLPINIQHNDEKTKWQFGNELVWASSFSNEIGYIDFDCLQNCSVFNLTGGIFNKKDFIRIGKLKPSIKVSFNYEFLLRATNLKLKVFVVPKEGYIHTIGRTNSLTDIYDNTLSDSEISKWFELAMRECYYTEDRKKGIIDNTEVLK